MQKVIDSSLDDWGCLGSQCYYYKAGLSTLYTVVVGDYTQTLEHSLYFKTVQENIINL